MIKSLIEFIKREWPDILFLPIGIALALLVTGVVMFVCELLQR